METRLPFVALNMLPASHFVPDPADIRRERPTAAPDVLNAHVEPFVDIGLHRLTLVPVDPPGIPSLVADIT